MSDNKKYYYMRLKENFFETESMVLLESMQDGLLYSNILLKMYLKSLKCNGLLMLTDMIPYNPQMIATITRHQVGTVEKALQVFEELGLIDVLDNGAIYMSDIELMVGQTSTEGERKRKARLQAKKTACGHLSDNRPPEIEIKKEIEIETELEKEIEIEIETETDKDLRPCIDYTKIIDSYNSICISYPAVKSLSDSRKKAIKARLRTYTEDELIAVFQKAEDSDFLKGKNDRNWSANFDWLIKDANMAKVLDGNYDNRTSKSVGKSNSGIDWNEV